MGKLSEAFFTLLLKRKIGWRRPWNISGVKVHIQRGVIAQLRQQIQTALSELELTEEEHAYVDDLLHDETLRLLISRHSRKDIADAYDGCTLSFGRKLPRGLLAYDRIDMIFQTKSERGDDDKLEHIRVFVAPYSTYIQNEFTMLTPQPTVPMQILYDTLSDKIVVEN